MYKISQIASFFGITAKTLYVYEKHSILTPAWVDPATGYRWYDNSSILRLSLIMQLKDSEMTLNEIGAHLSGDLTIQKQLHKLYARREAIERSIALLSGWVVPKGVYTVERGRFEARFCISRTLTAGDVSEIFTAHDALLTESVKRGVSIDTRYCSFCRPLRDIGITCYPLKVSSYSFTLNLSSAISFLSCSCICFLIVASFSPTVLT